MDDKWLGRLDRLGYVDGQIFMKKWLKWLTCALKLLRFLGIGDLSKYGSGSLRSPVDTNTDGDTDTCRDTNADTNTDTNANTGLPS